MPSSLSEAEDGTARAVSGSPNSTVSSFNVDFAGAAVGAGGGGGSAGEGAAERASSRASDEEENGNSRKKLRLSKEQSAFLEESFKEHSTLNPVSLPSTKILIFNFYVFLLLIKGWRYFVGVFF